MNGIPTYLEDQTNISKGRSYQVGYPALIRFQEVIDHRFFVDSYLGKIGELNVYVVKAMNMMSLCGRCGTQNEESVHVCVCGANLRDNRFLLFESNDGNTRGYGRLVFNSIVQHGLLKIFERFFYRNRYYVLTQFLDFRLLSDIVANSRTPTELEFF